MGAGSGLRAVGSGIVVTGMSRCIVVDLSAADMDMMEDSDAGEDSSMVVVMEDLGGTAGDSDDTDDNYAQSGQLSLLEVLGDEYLKDLTDG